MKIKREQIEQSLGAVFNYNAMYVRPTHPLVPTLDMPTQNIYFPDEITLELPDEQVEFLEESLSGEELAAAYAATQGVSDFQRGPSGKKTATEATLSVSKRKRYRIVTAKTEFIDTTYFLTVKPGHVIELEEVED